MSYIRVLSALMVLGPSTAEELSNWTDLPLKTVKNALRYWRQKGEVRKREDGRWELVGPCLG